MSTETPSTLHYSYLVRGTAAQHTLQVIGIDGAHLVQEARERHNLSDTATAALGRALLGTALLTQILDKHERSRVTVRFIGTGPVGGLVCEGSIDMGQLLVRGYAQHPEADLPIREKDGLPDVSGLLGLGELNVTRLLHNGEPYNSGTLLLSGEVAEDFADFLWESDQIRSAVLLGTSIEHGSISSAGGILIQAMPGVSEETLSKLEQNIAQFGSLSHALEHMSLIEVLDQLTAGLDLDLQDTIWKSKFQCRCSLEKALEAMVHFTSSEREEMIQAGGQEVVCHWCNTTYIIRPEDLIDLEERLANHKPLDA